MDKERKEKGAPVFKPQCEYKPMGRVLIMVFHDAIMKPDERKWISGP